MSDDDLVSMTITVSSEHAAYILALLSLWNPDIPFELDKNLIVLPDLIRDIARQLDMNGEIHSYPDDVIQSLKWTINDTQLLDLLLEHIHSALRLTTPPTVETAKQKEL